MKRNYLKMKKNYLSDSISDATQFSTTDLNLITAPAGSGKTHFALTKLPELLKIKHKERILYLIDTCAGRDQICYLNKDNAVFYDTLWLKEREDDYNFEKGFQTEPEKTVVMTYAFFGKLAFHRPAFLQSLDLIICDELHNTFWSIPLEKFKNEKTQQCALNKLEELSNSESCYVVALTATPKKILANFRASIQSIPLNPEPTGYFTKETVHYRNLQQELSKLDHNKKYLVYTKHISGIQKTVSFLQSAGYRAIGLWSMNNDASPMDDMQKGVRQYIIENQRLPDDIDILVFNKAYETSINIYGNIEAVFIQSQDEDTIIQARGRYRDDLNTLYLYAPSDDTLIVPDEYINVPLFKEDKDALALALNYRNPCGALYKWSAIKKKLIEQGYTILENPRINNRRSETILPSITH